jgi:hypothetical protein
MKMNSEQQRWRDALASIRRLRQQALAELRAALDEHNQYRAGQWRGELQELDACEADAKQALRALREQPQRAA